MTIFTKEQLIEQAKGCRMLAQCAVDARPDDVAAAKNLALAEIALAALGTDPRENPVLAYADSYRSMAMQGVKSIPILNVITDLERNIAPLYTYTPTTESEDRKMLKRLAVIMSGSDSGGEISALTVTAQSLVERCKTLAREKENSHIQWKPASPDEINKRSVREPTDIPSREVIIAGGVLIQCHRCHGDSYRLNFNGWTHFWCDKCANETVTIRDVYMEYRKLVDSLGIDISKQAANVRDAMWYGFSLAKSTGTKMTEGK